MTEAASPALIHIRAGNLELNHGMDHVLPPEEDADVPALVHAGHAPVGTEHTGPGAFGSLLARHPELMAIVAHMGAPDYEEFLRLAADHERVALDTTMIFTDFFDKLAPFPAASLPLVRELGLAGKILLGSDFPNIPYPYARQIGGLARLGLGQEWLRAVCRPAGPGLRRPRPQSRRPAREPRSWRPGSPRRIRAGTAGPGGPHARACRAPG